LIWNQSWSTFSTSIEQSDSETTMVCIKDHSSALPQAMQGAGRP
jgi:hypothetical protein